MLSGRCFRPRPCPLGRPKQPARFLASATHFGRLWPGHKAKPETKADAVQTWPSWAAQAAEVHLQLIERAKGGNRKPRPYGLCPTPGQHGVGPMGLSSPSEATSHLSTEHIQPKKNKKEG